MQADLFQVSSPVVDASKVTRPHTGWLDRFSVTLRLDHLSIVAISALVLYVLVFSFGVEKGKRFALQELAAKKTREEQISKELAKASTVKANLAAPGAVKASVPDLSKQAAQNKKADKEAAVSATSPVSAAAVSEAKGRYTIQIITFKSKTLAEKEVEKLKSKGHQGFVIPAGKFFHVCVDRFETTHDASEKLGALRSEGLIPPDAYVRPLNAL